MSQAGMSRKECQDLVDKMSGDNKPDASIDLFRSGVSNLVRNITEGVYKTEIKPLTKTNVLERSAPNSDTLKISLTDINAIEENAFEDRPNLESIDLSSNSILFVDSHTFTRLNNLKKLILSFNQINSLEAQTFSNVPTLQELELTNSGLKVINNKAFTGLINLKRLILAYNEIEFIDPDTFIDLRKLELLVLSFNKIKSVNNQTFRNLKNLKRLNLKANSLSSLSPIVLSHLENVEQIILSVNNLTSIDNVFSSLVNLERLFIHTNKVAKLTADCFRNLRKCVFIDMGNNQIREIDKNAFDDLTNLEYLDLGRNLIKSLDKDTFRSLGKVEQLILSKNSISSLKHADTFSGMNNLKFLLIDFNKLTFIDPATFASLTTLQEIYCNTLSVDNMKALQDNIIKHNESNFMEDVKHIASQRDDISSLLSSYETFKRVERVSFFTNRHKIKLFKSVDSRTLKKLAKVVTLGLNTIFADLKTHIVKYKPFINKPECLMLKYLNAFTSIIKNWSNTVITFCSYFYDYDGIKILMNYLNSDVLKTSLIEKINDDSKYLFMILMSIMGNMLSSVYNLIKKEDIRYQNRIVGLNAFECLIKIAESFDSIGDFRLKSYLCLSEIVDDKNVDHLVNIKIVIKDLVEYVRICASNLEEEGQSKLERCPLVVEDDEAKNVREALIIEVNDTYFYVTEFLNVLYNFAISDETKFDIYENCKMRDYLKVFIDRGNMTEREYALKLLWQLCFDKRIAQHVSSQQDILNRLKEFGKLKVNDENKNVIKNSKGILWLLEDEKGKHVQKVTEDKQQQNQQHQDDDKLQIMISYNSKSRDTCLKIKSELEKAGFRVWIDIESIYGSSLSAMANAIETSFCVLMCVTEKYKESNFCRLEAEYLVQQKKPYIPLFLQPGYKPNGWLGLVIGSRIYIDFDKLGFDNSILELKRNINLILKETGVSMRVLVENNSNNTSTDRRQEEKAAETKKTKEETSKEEIAIVRAEELNWSEQQVDNWMKEMKINETIATSLLPCDGQVLHQIYTMLKTNPEFYYSSMRNSGLNSLKDLKDVAYFSKELTKLFEK